MARIWAAARVRAAMVESKVTSPGMGLRVDGARGHRDGWVARPRGGMMHGGRERVSGKLERGGGWEVEHGRTGARRAMPRGRTQQQPRP